MNFRTGPDGGVIYYGVQYEVAKALAGAHNAGLTFAPPEDGKWGSIVNKGELKILFEKKCLKSDKSWEPEEI